MTPMPMPALAPVESPLEWDDGEADGDDVDDRLLVATAGIVLEEIVDEIEDESVVEEVEDVEEEATTLADSTNEEVDESVSDKAGVIETNVCDVDEIVRGVPETASVVGFGPNIVEEPTVLTTT